MFFLSSIGFELSQFEFDPKDITSDASRSMKYLAQLIQNVNIQEKNNDPLCIS